MYIVPCLTHSLRLEDDNDEQNRILTGYCPLGSGSGPIGALLLGSRMNGYNFRFLLFSLTLGSGFRRRLYE